MKKQYVLDTNVILYDPQAIFRFDDNEVVIPIAVIEEIDRFKKDMTETGRNARMASRYIDELRDKGSLASGVPLESGGLLTVDVIAPDFKKIGRPFPIPKQTDADDFIMMTALRRHQEFPDKPVVFITKDTNLRILADSFGLTAVDYEPDTVQIDELYTGTGEVVLDAKKFGRLQDHGELSVDESYVPNQFLTVTEENTNDATVLARYHAPSNKLRRINGGQKDRWGVRARNREQTYALDLLMDDEVRLVTLVGKAGTGKTLLALAAGLFKTIDEAVYTRLLVSRPVFPLGRDIGFLPGDLEEKLLPWMQPIFDNIEFLLGNSDWNNRRRNRQKNYQGYHQLMDMGMLSIEPLTYIRGRSIPNQYLIVDEAQNLTPHEIKTIVTRVGHGTKIVITGDPYQIDNPYVDASNNGLTHVVNRFKGQLMAGHITLVKGERSKLAELAANIL